MREQVGMWVSYWKFMHESQEKLRTFPKLETPSPTSILRGLASKRDMDIGPPCGATNFCFHKFPFSKFIRPSTATFDANLRESNGVDCNKALVMVNSTVMIKIAT